MVQLGAHMSISGGVEKAFDRICEVGGEVLQIFTKNQRQWRAKPLAAQEIELFRQKWTQCGNMPVAAHASYLINLAALPGEAADKSLQALVDELQRCDQLGVPYLVIHPGSHGGDGEEMGIKRAIELIALALGSLVPDSRVMLLLETTAGQGNSLGANFEQLAAIMNGLPDSRKMGICLDTCHIFAAGYDIRTKESYNKTITELDEKIGIDRLRFVHLNDSKNPLGSKVDRHEHIGRGEIGAEAFRCLLNDPRLADLPMILETPKSKDMAEDRENLAMLRSLIT
ncbi:MAG: deoxyribonuclease IV [Desulfobulbaceae bacterium]|nr:deoxyribonuclease IV [Desulfobulbaceae bacterium]